MQLLSILCTYIMAGFRVTRLNSAVQMRTPANALVDSSTSRFTLTLLNRAASIWPPLAALRKSALSPPWYALKRHGCVAKV